MTFTLVGLYGGASACDDCGSLVAASKKCEHERFHKQIAAALGFQEPTQASHQQLREDAAKLMSSMFATHQAMKAAGLVDDGKPKDPAEDLRREALIKAGVDSQAEGEETPHAFAPNPLDPPARRYCLVCGGTDAHWTHDPDAVRKPVEGLNDEEQA